MPIDAATAASGEFRVRAVVVNFRGEDVTQRCVESLLDDACPGIDLSVVVVDNSPGDGVAPALRRLSPRVEVRATARNEGFARGCNVGLRDLDGIDAVALVNNDAVVERGWLAPLVARLSVPDVGAVSPKIVLDLWAQALVIDAESGTGVVLEGVRVEGVELGERLRFDERWSSRRPTRAGACAWWPVEAVSAPQRVQLDLVADGECIVRVGDPAQPSQVRLSAGRNLVDCISSGPLRIVNSAGGGLYAGWLGGDIGYLEPDLGQFDEPGEVFGWCGGAVLLRAAYLRDIGLFDPSMFVYYEDFDMSCRGRRRGWRHAYEPASVVRHEHGWSTRGNSDVFRFWNDRNRRIAVLKNAPLRPAARAVLGAVRSGPGVALSVLGALPGSLVRRWRTARRAVVPAAALEQWMRVR